MIAQVTLTIFQDLKADNILVEMSGICKISDFGISKRTEELDGGAFTAMQGTVFWMAPEVIKTQKSGYNNKVDIWSVGCLVVEMLTGEHPWAQLTQMQAIFKVCDGGGGGCSVCLQTRYLLRVSCRSGRVQNQHFLRIFHPSAKTSFPEPSI